MITVSIGPAQATIEQADKGWLNQQINRRRADGAVVCGQVHIQEQDVRVVLSTPACAANNGGWRPPNPREKRILDVWSERGLDRTDFTGGAVVAFLHQVRRLL